MRALVTLLVHCIYIATAANGDQWNSDIFVYHQPIDYVNLGDHTKMSIDRSV